MPQNFFDYFPVAPKLRTWGIYSTSFGTVRVPAGAAYPPARHPGSHHLAWNQRRKQEQVDTQLLLGIELRARSIVQQALAKLTGSWALL